MEIIITILIVILALFIIIKNIHSSAKGHCDHCDHCGNCNKKKNYILK